MTPRTPQCEGFWPLLLNSKHLGVPEDSKSQTLGVLGFTPTLGQSGVATNKEVFKLTWSYKKFLMGKPLANSNVLQVDDVSTWTMSIFQLSWG